MFRLIHVFSGQIMMSVRIDKIINVESEEGNSNDCK
jgi:hypothetical protein